MSNTTQLTGLMIRKEFAHIRKDSLTIRLIIFPVFIQLLVLGYALTTEVKNTPVAVFDMSRSPQSRSLVASISNNKLFRFAQMLESRDQAREMLDNGTIRAALIIPSDFSVTMSADGDTRVQLLIDGQDANSANVAAGYLRAIVSQWGMEQYSNRLAGKGIDIHRLIPLTVSLVILFNPLLKSTWYMIPALVVLLVTMVTSLLTGFSIVREKENGTLEQLMVTPLEPVNVILGKTIPYLIIGLAELMAFLVVATLWFRIPFRGSVVTFVIFGVIYMISSLGIGILTSTIAKTPQQVLFLIWFILIFFILLSGFFIPVENMPGWVQNITLINPVRFFMSAVRQIFLKGSGIRELMSEAFSMLLIGFVVLGTSVLAFNRRAK